jgi:hypothetical protein
MRTSRLRAVKRRRRTPADCAFKILEACEVHENHPLPGQTLGVGERIDASRWLDAS